MGKKLLIFSVLAMVIGVVCGILIFAQEEYNPDEMVTVYPTLILTKPTSAYIDPGVLVCSNSGFAYACDEYGSPATGNITKPYFSKNNKKDLRLIIDLDSDTYEPGMFIYSEEVKNRQW